LVVLENCFMLTEFNSTCSVRKVMTAVRIVLISRQELDALPENLKAPSVSMLFEEANYARDVIFPGYIAPYVRRGSGVQEFCAKDNSGGLPF